MRLFALDFHEVIVVSAFGLVKYHPIEISSSPHILIVNQSLHYSNGFVSVSAQIRVQTFLFYLYFRTLIVCSRCRFFHSSLASKQARHLIFLQDEKRKITNHPKACIEREKCTGNPRLALLAHPRLASLAELLLALADQYFSTSTPIRSLFTNRLEILCCNIIVGARYK